MEHQTYPFILIDVENKDINNDDYYFGLLSSQSFPQLIPISAKDFNPVDLFGRIYIFKIKKEGKQDISKAGIPRQVSVNENKFSFKVNGKPFTQTRSNTKITKRTLTAPPCQYALWEYVIDSDDTWTILHRYGLKKGIAGVLIAEMATYQPEQCDDPDQFLNQQHDSLAYVPDIDMLNVTEENPVNEGQAEPVNEVTSPNVFNIAAHRNFQMLTDNIARKTFFNRPIQIYEELFKFKAQELIPELNEAKEVIEKLTDVHMDFKDLTRNNFEYFVNHRFVHLVAPAGTGKTMALTQLAKSYDLDQPSLIPVVCKAEYFWSLRERSLFECVLYSSMYTANISQEYQREWCENLAQLIRDAGGIILLLDSVDELTSEDRSEFMYDLIHKMGSVPGAIDGVNIEAMVLSSKPGFTLQNVGDAQWTTLNIDDNRSSYDTLKVLCAEDTVAFERALRLQKSFKFPSSLFWYSLLAIEAQTLNPARPLPRSQSEFLEEVLLHSLTIAQRSIQSYSEEQQQLINVNPVVLLQFASVIAYLTKKLGTTRIADIATLSARLMPDFGGIMVNENDSILTMLLPFYQRETEFFRCCYACNKDSKFKYLRFDHQIIWDFLAAYYLVKKVEINPLQVNEPNNLKFDWQKTCINAVTEQSQWTQTMHFVAEELTPMQFLLLMTGYNQQQAIKWIKSVLNHSRCRDIAGIASDEAKFTFLISCLFNASTKRPPQMNKNQQKKQKSGAIQLTEDDEFTSLCFQLVLHLFKQTTRGERIMKDICQYKSLLILYDELRQRDHGQRFLDLLINKFFNDPEVPMSIDVVFLISQLLGSDSQNTIMEGLLRRLSSKYEEECSDKPHLVRKMIYTTFILVFEEELCGDFLIEKLKSTETPVRRSAAEVLRSFDTLSLTRVKQIINLIPTDVEIVDALPRNLPQEVFEELKDIAVTLPSPSRLFYPAFNKIPATDQRMIDKFIKLFDDKRMRFLAYLWLGTHAHNTLSTENIEKLAYIYANPSEYVDDKFDSGEKNGLFEVMLQKCIKTIASHQQLTEDHKYAFDLVGLPSLEECLELLYSTTLTSFDSLLSLKHYLQTTENAMLLLELVCQKFKELINAGTTEGPLLDAADDLYDEIVARKERHLIASDYIMDRLVLLLLKGKTFDSTQLARLLKLLTVTVPVQGNLHGFINLGAWEKVLSMITMNQPASWDIDNVVTLCKVIGTLHYQQFHDICKGKILPTAAAVIIENWPGDQVRTLIEILANMELSYPLQIGMMNAVTQLAVEKDYLQV